MSECVQGIPTSVGLYSTLPHYLGAGRVHAGEGGGGASSRPQRVRFASSQLAPTVPTTTVFIAFSSVYQIQSSEFAV